MRSFQTGVVAVEVLESRRLLSASLVNNVLVVHGTAGPDSIQVWLGAGGRSIRVSANGDEQNFSVGRVRGISIDAGRGRDEVAVAHVSLRRNARGGVTVMGGEGDDSIVGSSGRDVIYGGDGDDDIRGRGGNDSCFGGSGRDDIFGESGDDVIFGGQGRDNLNGGRGRDRVSGDEDEDFVAGDSGTDSVQGGGGRDQVLGGAGVDFFDVADDDLEKQDRVGGRSRSNLRGASGRGGGSEGEDREDPTRTGVVSRD